MDATARLNEQHDNQKNNHLSRFSPIDRKALAMPFS